MTNSRWVVLLLLPHEGSSYKAHELSLGRRRVPRVSPPRISLPIAPCLSMATSEIHDLQGANVLDRTQIHFNNDTSYSRHFAPYGLDVLGLLIGHMLALEIEDVRSDPPGGASRAGFLVARSSRNMRPNLPRPSVRSMYTQASYEATVAESQRQGLVCLSERYMCRSGR